MKDAIIEAVTELNDELAFRLVREALAGGVPCEDIQQGLNIGVENVGRLYEESDYFVSDLILAGFIHKEILDMEELRAYIEAKQEGKTHGNILACTVKDDIHDIGKNIFISMAKASGFNVYDMGIDVSPEAIVDTIEKRDIDILALSGTMAGSARYVEETIALLVRRGIRGRVKVMIGGLVVNDCFDQAPGVDFATKDVDLSIEQCKKWTAEKYGL